MKKTILEKINNITYSLLSLGILTYGISSFAHNHHCVETEYVPLENHTFLSGECRLSVPLNLVETYFTYPKMSHNPRRVEVWEGAFERTQKEEKTYLKQLVDVCRGRVISEKKITERKKYQLKFSVENPNLDPTLSESYKLAPMTEREAEKELKKAKYRCQRYQPPGQKYVD